MDRGGRCGGVKGKAGLQSTQESDSDEVSNVAGEEEVEREIEEEVEEAW